MFDNDSDMLVATCVIMLDEERNSNQGKTNVQHVGYPANYDEMTAHEKDHA